MTNKYYIMQVLVVSSNSIGPLNHGTVQKGSPENTIQLSRIPTNSLQHQNVTIIPYNINCGESITGCYIFNLNIFVAYIL